MPYRISCMEEDCIFVEYQDRADDAKVIADYHKRRSGHMDLVIETMEVS